MSNTVCVVYSDIIGWSKQNVAEQITTAQELFEHLVLRMTKYGLEPIWKTSTGDGFAVAFDRDHCPRVLLLCFELRDQYYKRSDQELRLAVAEGSIESFPNPLLDGDLDYTGPSVVKARRILDGITAGNVLLIQQELAEDVRGQLPDHMIPYLVAHPDINDKHGNTHRVIEALSMLGMERKEFVGIPPSIQELAASTKSVEIVGVDQFLGKGQITVDGLIILWMDDRQTGLEATAVQVIPQLSPTGNPDSLIGLPDLGGVFIEQAAPNKAEVERNFGLPNNPKVWLKDYRSPLSDRPAICLFLGKTDYWTTKSLELAFDSGVLRNMYENGELDFFKDLPGLVASIGIILTSDNHLILAQRKGGEVDSAGGTYSASFEEQWNPFYDKNPYETVLRGLSEEFNLDPRHGVHVSVDNLRLVALAREWGSFWNTVLVYLVKLPVPAKKVLECWNAVPPPKDKHEHVAIIAVPLSNRKGVDFLQSLLNRSGRVSVKLMKEVCGEERISGRPSDGDLHPTSGRARILFGLFTSGSLGSGS